MDTTPVDNTPKQGFHEPNHTLPSVLVIGTDTGVLSEGSEHRARMLGYAQHMRELHIVVLGNTAKLPEKIEIGPSVFAYPTHTTSRIAALREGLALSKQIVESHHIDVISTQDPFETALLGYCAKRHSTHVTKLNIQEHGDFFFQPYWRRERLLHAARYYLGLWLVRRADCIRAVSERIKQKLAARGIPESSIGVVPVRTDLSQFQDPVPNKELLKLRPENGILMLTMGRFVPQKNLDMLIRAFAQRASTNVPARLLIVGEGPGAAHLEALAQELAPDTITFLPWTDDIPGYMAAADVYALPSHYEGWGRVCIEALAAGTSLVMTDVGCAGEVVHDEQNGLVVPVNNQAAFMQALDRLITDSALRVSLAENGKKTIAEMPTKREHDALYKKSFECCLAPGQNNEHINT